MAPTIQIENNRSIIHDEINYACSILLGKNYLTFALTDTDFKTIHTLKHFNFEDKIIGKQDFDDVLSDAALKNISSVKVGIDTLKSTLVPAAFYESGSEEKYLQFMFDILPEEGVHSQKVNTETMSVFSLKKATVSFLQARLNKVSFYDASACLIPIYPSLIFNEFAQTFFLSIKDENATITVFAQKKLMLHQVYAETDAMQLLYHIANIIEQQKLDKEKLSIQLNGESKEVEKTFFLLSSYFPNLKYCARPQTITFPEGIFVYPSHYFLNLFALISCAS